MNVQKLNRVNVCLYAMSSIKLAGGLYMAVTMSSLGFKDVFSSDISSVASSGLILAVALVVFSVFIVDGLKKQKLWAWVAAITVFLIGVPSLALPASLIGLLSLLDVEVRTPFLKELDLKF